MTERRQQPDRRTEPRGGRRIGDHGTRNCYKAGCRELRCKAAEAAYRSARRQQQAKGQPAGGTLIPAGRLWRMIRALQGEQYSILQIAGMLGLKTAKIQFNHSHVTLKSFCRVRALYKKIMLDL
jgi:hypothetical protein